MIRSFDWRDIGLVGRVGRHGLCLDSETGFTRGIHSTQSALLAYMTPGAGHPTLVCRYEDHGKGQQSFGQLRHRRGTEVARLLYVAPAEAFSVPVGMELLEGLCREAGRRGAHHVLAEVGERDTAFETLRTLGFAIYARQDIYRLPGSVAINTLANTRLRLQQPADEFGIRTLYANTVPRLVQQVEPPPVHRHRGFVHASGGEVFGYFDVVRGPLGVWIEPYIHPAAESVSDLLPELIQNLGGGRGRPIHFCVRSYVDWMKGPLLKAGFELCAEQAVMVKRLAVPIVEFQPKPVPVIDGRSKATTPYVKTDAGGRRNGSSLA